MKKQYLPYQNPVRLSLLLITAACCLVMSLGSCTDEDWINAGQADNSNLVRFQVTSGITSDLFSETRSRAAQDTSDLLQPLVLKSPELERPLYLHTYVAEEYERSTGAETVSRAEPVNDMDDFVSLTEGKFHVQACYTDNPDDIFMPENTEVQPYEGNNSIWSTATNYYWPENNRLLHFSAIAPTSAETLLEDLSITNEEISFNYTVPKTTDSDTPKDAEQQPDIMFAIAECNKSTSDDGKVPLNFRHALSAIKFAVRDVVDGTIERITISGVAGSGHCTYQLPATEGDGFFTWSDFGEATSYSQQFDYEVSGITTPPSSDGKEDIVLNDKMPEMTFLLIPQKLTDDASIEIVFNRKDGESFILSGKINDNLVTEWESGKEYVYTISTSSSNWTYHFEVIGCEQTLNEDNPSAGTFSDDDSHIIVNSTVVEGAYYKVKSYRERANNPNIKESIPWEITNISDGTTTFPTGLDDYYQYVEQADLTIDDEVWMPGINREGGKGSAIEERHSVTFCPQMVGTDWAGDWQMRSREEKGTSEAPIDLSMINGSMSTANCYVINSAGYYKLPLVYGNAITDGSKNSKSWTCNQSDRGIYPALNTFTDYQGNQINGPKITGNITDAILVWEDAYNLITDVKVNPNDGAYGSLSFKVNKENIQQGNAVLAIRDNTKTIMWSWHIWITEHWTNGKSLQLGIKDVTCEAYDNGYGTFDVAPYNLGWCDPKNVWYMKRTGTIDFKQEGTGKTAKLDVEQREQMIEYWIGNNVYYQFGRKDPIVGFMNSGSVVKYNFGDMPYGIEPQPKDIKDGIQHPNILYVGGEPVTTNNDWLKNSYHNLWNNTSVSIETSLPSNTNMHAYHYSGVKTVYDPSPAGYQVPPVNFFKIITSNMDDSSASLSFNGYYEGISGHEGFYRYYAYSEKNGVNGDPTILLTGTGHRWYANTGPNAATAGSNFNPDIVYLWSNQINFSSDNRAAYGLALGGENDRASNFRFIGRRSMARPVRPVKEFNR